MAAPLGAVASVPENSSLTLPVNTPLNPSAVPTIGQRALASANNIAVACLPNVPTTQPQLTQKQTEELAMLRACVANPTGEDFQEQARITRLEYDASITLTKTSLRELNGAFKGDPESLLHKSAQQPDQTEHQCFILRRDCAQKLLEKQVSTIKAHIGKERYDATIALELQTLRGQQAVLCGTRFADPQSSLHTAHSAWNAMNTRLQQLLADPNHRDTRAQELSTLQEHVAQLRGTYDAFEINNKTISAEIAQLTSMLELPAAESDIIHERTLLRLNARIAELEAIQTTAHKPAVDWSRVQHTVGNGVSAAGHFVAGVSLARAEQRDARETRALAAKKRQYPSTTHIAVASGIALVASFALMYFQYTTATDTTS